MERCLTFCLCLLVLPAHALFDLSSIFLLSFYSQGSEATETALKLSRQYYLELQPPQPTRHIFISRRQSYHGATLAALAVSGHTARRANFEPLMLPHMRQVSPCNSYRFRFAGETDEVYVARLAKELEVEIVGAGPHNVCAFIAETVVGAVSALFNLITLSAASKSQLGDL